MVSLASHNNMCPRDGISKEILAFPGQSLNGLKKDAEVIHKFICTAPAT